MDDAYKEEEIVAALHRAGVPVNMQTEFVAFQKKYGGRDDAFGLNKFRWGIIHRTPEWIEADRVEAELDDEGRGIWHVNCADVHPSDTMTMDQMGRLYWCWRLRYHHYEQYFSGQPPLEWSTEHE